MQIIEEKLPVIEMISIKKNHDCPLESLSVEQKLASEEPKWYEIDLPPVNQAAVRWVQAQSDIINLLKGR